MLRFFLNDNPISNLGRVVMLGIDSELSNNIDASANSSDSYQSVDYDVGVITDSKQAPLFVTLLLSKQEEWLVVQTPVATPKIEILVTPENSATEHLFFTIIEQALHFIRNGYFIN